MAISVTEILGTDSLSGSRIVINDNFNILANEINSMETYFSPSAGTITNLNNLQTDALRVGLSTVRLDINASTFDIIANVNVEGGDVNLNGGGLTRNNVDPQTLDDIFAGSAMIVNVGTSTALPPYTIERVGNNTTTPLSVIVNEGKIGQELIFVYSLASTGLVEIQAVLGSGDFVLSGGGTMITLDQLGASVHLLCVDNGTGNGDWYVIGGDEYTIS